MTNNNNHKNKGKAKKQVSSSLRRSTGGALIAPVSTFQKENNGFNKAKITSSKGKMRVSNKEYITDVAGNILFTATKLAINAGVDATFPWLAPIANQFESYIFHKLRFYFRTESPTSKSGTVMLAPDYNASDGVPLDKNQMLQYHDATRGPTWDTNLKMDCSKESLHKRKTYYIRSGPLSPDQDIKSYDVGSLICAVKGQPDVSDIGELWVEYDVELNTPRATPDNCIDCKIDTVTATNAAPWNGSTVSNGAGGTPFLVYSSNQLICQVPGEYLFSGWVVGTSVNFINWNNAIQPDPLTGGTLARIQSNGASTIQLYIFRVKVGAGDRVVFDYTPATTVTQHSLRISKYEYALA